MSTMSHISHSSDIVASRFLRFIWLFTIICETFAISIHVHSFNGLLSVSDECFRIKKHSWLFSAPFTCLDVQLLSLFDTIVIFYRNSSVDWLENCQSDFFLAGCFLLAAFLWMGQQDLTSGGSFVYIHENYVVDEYETLRSTDSVCISRLNH